MGSILTTCIHQNGTTASEIKWHKGLRNNTNRWHYISEIHGTISLKCLAQRRANYPEGNVDRAIFKWSQDDLAKKIGTSAPIIGRYGRNEIKPSIEIAKKIADELGITVDYLLGGSDKMVLDKKN